MNQKFRKAEERLEKALQRIDAAIEDSLNAKSGASSMADLEAENKILRQRNDDIAARLDRAVEKLQRILNTP